MKKLPEKLNSRQRRKLAAKRHNDRLIEEEAYGEDRLRDPDKYSVVYRESRPAQKAISLAALLALSYVPYRGR